MRPLVADKEYYELLSLIGDRIKELRKKKGISYIKMASEAGISRNCYNNLELGVTNFQFEILYRVISCHKITVFDFFKSLEQ